MVKSGYKQTEIGSLPELWDTITFEDCFGYTESLEIP